MDPANKYTSKYLDESNEPLYPFGYGLSYTSFKYDQLTLSQSRMSQSDKLIVSCRIANTGRYAGEEVVQLYIRDKVGSVTRPVKELKGFKKIFLEPGQSQQVEFSITNDDLSFYRRDMSYGSEPGEFEVFVGGNSRDLLSAAFLLEGSR